MFLSTSTPISATLCVGYRLCPQILHWDVRDFEVTKEMPFPISYQLISTVNSIMVCRLVISCRIFEHFATLPDPVAEFIKLRSALHRQGTILVPKQADLLSLLKKQTYPFHLERVFYQTWIQQPWCRSTQYLYYINMLVRLKSTVMNQILSCQLVFLL